MLRALLWRSSIIWDFRVKTLRIATTTKALMLASMIRAILRLMPVPDTMGDFLLLMYPLWDFSIGRPFAPMQPPCNYLMRQGIVRDDRMPLRGHPRRSPVRHSRRASGE